MDDSKCKLKNLCSEMSLPYHKAERLICVLRSITLGTTHKFKFNWTGTQSDTQRLHRGF
jgi:hypothetical protein